MDSDERKATAEFGLHKNSDTINSAIQPAPNRDNTLATLAHLDAFELCERATKTLLEGRRHFSYEDHHSLDAAIIVFYMDHDGCVHGRDQFLQEAKNNAAKMDVIPIPPISDMTRSDFSMRNYCGNEYTEKVWSKKIEPTVEVQRYYALTSNTFGNNAGSIAFSYVEKDFEAAMRKTNEALSLALKYPCNWNFGNAFYAAYTFKGLLAFDRDDLLTSAAYFLVSATGPGSPQSSSFGLQPDLFNRFNNINALDLLNAFETIVDKSIYMVGYRHNTGQTMMGSEFILKRRESKQP